MKINNRQDLNKIYDQYKGQINNRLEALNVDKKEILICAGTGCLSSKSIKIAELFEEKLKENNLDINVVKTGCFGFCEKGPIVKIMPDDIFYTQLKLDDVEKIIEKHLIGGEIYKARLYRNPEDKQRIEKTSDIPFYKKQVRIALQNCGLIAAESLEEYIGVKGYQAMDKCLKDLTPREVIGIIKDSKLRGRGGGGFSTGRKWELTADVKAEERYIICNADEGDPGAFMDRSILEGDSHSVIEAMVINAYATSATMGYVYVRAEYPIAVDRLEIAIDKAYKAGLLGKNILDSGFDFDIEIRLGAGAFVCGEETALIASIEGNRGMPCNRPPYPAVKGLWDKSTNVNNVETYACIPKIILNGANWFANIGTEKSTGTKVFALGGNVQNTGLIEVPMGTTLREVIYDIGGGIRNRRSFKAVQTGGPSGGCLTSDMLDAKIDFDNLTSLGSMMGSGGMIVMDEDNCMVDICKFYLEFTVEESCGKCTPCREGTKKMLDILERIAKGDGKMKDLDQLEELAKVTANSSLCGLGQTAPNPILSSLKHFREEFEAHILHAHCEAGVCANITDLYINDKCIGCQKCKKNCPTDCISGGLKERHFIDQINCINCNTCRVVCPVDAIVVEK
ncbi:MAG: NADH-quinone oxidoreductase subunit NuoF [Spiroplasma sp.]|nr:NADH-quinone oxidoreductase subunit NuoF [Mycoplasmatales bacterium]